MDNVFPYITRALRRGPLIGQNGNPRRVACACTDQAPVKGRCRCGHHEFTHDDGRCCALVAARYKAGC